MLFPLALPAGIYRNGTEYQSKNRYFDMNLVRFNGGAIMPHGGWRVKSTTAVTGVARFCIAWRADAALTFAAIGTESHLYAMGRTGVIADITPSGFTAGNANALAGGGFGRGRFGRGTFGTPRPDGGEVTDATMWTGGTRGQDLVACTADDGKLYEWVPGDPAAVIITNAPTQCRGVFVTPERFVMAGGAGGDPRLMQWCDQEDDTVWAPSATNQAGNFPLQSPGKFMLGIGAKGYSLVLTDIDAHIVTYVGGTGIYGFEQVGDTGSGAVSQGCAAATGAQTVWMGQNGFWECNGGFVQILACEVQDYVFSDINRQQFSIVTCTHYPDFGEILWRYPSAGSTEIDRYVIYSYAESPPHWEIGKLARLSGVPRGVFQYPLAIGTDGYVYEHEVGSDYGGLVPYLETGPYELGGGDNVATTAGMIPDENTVGAITVTFTARFKPQGDESVFGPYVCSQKNDFRFTARQVKAKYEFANINTRLGNVRLDVTVGGRR